MAPKTRTQAQTQAPRRGRGPPPGSSRASAHIKPTRADRRRKARSRLFTTPTKPSTIRARLERATRFVELAENDDDDDIDELALSDQGEQILEDVGFGMEWEISNSKELQSHEVQRRKTDNELPSVAHEEKNEGGVKVEMNLKVEDQPLGGFKEEAKDEFKEPEMEHKDDIMSSGMDDNKAEEEYADLGSNWETFHAQVARLEFEPNNIDATEEAMDGLMGSQVDVELRLLRLENEYLRLKVRCHEMEARINQRRHAWCIVM